MNSIAGLGTTQNMQEIGAPDTHLSPWLAYGATHQGSPKPDSIDDLSGITMGQDKARHHDGGPDYNDFFSRSRWSRVTENTKGTEKLFCSRCLKKRPADWNTIVRD